MLLENNLVIIQKDEGDKTVRKNESRRVQEAKAFYADRYLRLRGSGYDDKAARIATERYMKEVGLWPAEWR